MAPEPDDTGFEQPADAGPAPESAPADAGLESTEAALGFDETVEARRPRKLWRWVVSVLFTLLFLVAIAGAALWVTDYKVTADVEETRCDLSQVTVRARQFGLEHTVQDVPLTQCLLLEPGDYVEYRIRSQRTTLYDADGDCVYDSTVGPC